MYEVDPGYFSDAYLRESEKTDLQNRTLGGPFWYPSELFGKA